MQTAPLRGLDKRVDESREQMQAFYAKRIPANYSSIASRIGDLEVKSGVRLSRLQYTQGAPAGDLTEISMDAGISGEYPQIMRFVNGLERDQNFFVDPGHGADRAAGRPGESAAAGFHLAARGGCGQQRIAARPQAEPAQPAAPARQGGRIAMALALGTENKRRSIC